MSNFKDKPSRRAFLEGTGAALVAATAPVVRAQNAGEKPAPVPRTTIHLTVNGTAHRVEVEDRWTLVELLRDHLGLTGTKIGCDRGECGACTVIANGTTIYSCTTLTHAVADKEITTIEGIAKDGQLHPVQRAFIAEIGPQCGFCTPGQVMSAVALLQVNPHPTMEEARRAMSGNLCRCGSYNQYLAGVMRAAKGDFASAGGNNG
jgi:aerobic-type carbon monoxide dehydrogenase small subunit (CoxS/CutS family)